MAETEAAQGTPTEATLDRRVRARTGTKRYRTEVTARGHTSAVDEPVRLGGGDLGPTPFDLLCAALGSCTTITLRMYADRKGWPLEEISAEVEHRRVAVAGAEANDSSTDRFTVLLELTGAIDEAQRNRLLEIASRCPVHQLLLRGATIDTRLAE